MDDAEDLRARFASLRSDLEMVEKGLREWLDTCAQQCRAREFYVSSRTKQVHSFVRKVMRKDVEGSPYLNPFRDMTDKVGVRIDVLYLDDLGKLCDRIRAETQEFTILKEDVKQPAPDVLDYLGVHFDVRPLRLPEGLSEAYATCEVQVRTMAQAAWAMASHDLLYKSPIEVPGQLRRRVTRLMALLELFDEEVGRARMEIVNEDSYPAAQFIDALEETLMRYTAAGTDPELTRAVIDALLRDRDPKEVLDLAVSIKEWAADNSDRLAELYDHYQQDGRSPLLFQPEAIFVFWELDAGDRYRLRDTWEARLPEKYLKSLATIWGEPY